ncbi:Monooxygenase, FAD-binding [Penicillium griseofulvum]|uniref:Monooxygenase, FAD-binding n=1 Tax=Penicillium patulum TaxID=5078 RepID=A0A135LH68_PENPA|nr:Monooxygenase, FAD-binding [Penicillium griseofulvum]KXG48295.1 Monooxygenase, FAD-binding [Penicillium griseofulvum]
METTDVLIVGAGPSGLVLGALLGRMGIKVVILEKDKEVCEDPRGIVVNGDAVRISYQVGIGEGLTKRIGSDIGALNFHAGNFRQRPFMIFDLMPDWAEQSLSQNITQFQPNYEREIRALIKTIPACDLRVGCEVLSRIENEDHTIIEYRTADGTLQYIRTSWLVGADGKRGIVRKRFLEPEGIKQVDAVWPYVGTWIAINLEVDLPTPKTHPDFPLWELGYTPEQVHSTFWPKGFHFCNDTHRPAVSGRFGPKGARFWRHEYSIGNEKEPEDCEQDFWNQFEPWMNLPGSQFSSKLKGLTVAYPRDCIKVLRCRPFRFATKVVNRWYCRQTMLIGDAAHVFPPFGGQGIATGIRDAQGLGWRLSMMIRLGVTGAVRERILQGWSQERRHAWEAATLSTKLNGSIANMGFGWRESIYRFCMRLLWWLPGGAKIRTRRAFKDKLIYNSTTCPDGFFLQSAGGGQKIAQVWVQQQGKDLPQLSDEVLLRDRSHIAVLVLVKKASDFDPASVDTAVEELKIPGDLLASENITYINLTGGNLTSKNGVTAWNPCSADALEQADITPVLAYNKDALQSRVPSSAKYVILRPDFFIHSVASDLRGLKANLQHAKDYFGV